MSRPRFGVIAIADFSPALAGTAMTAPQALMGTDHGPDRAGGEAAMYKLSRRLWTLEIHRRLELQARRML